MINDDCSFHLAHLFVVNVKDDNDDDDADDYDADDYDDDDDDDDDDDVVTLRISS